MHRSKILVLLATILCVFCMGVIECVVAGETVKLKATATSINTKWHQIEVGDAEGHIIAVMENTQLWVSDPAGEKWTARSRGTMDLNTKTGQGTMQGYGVYTYSNGDKRFGKWEGKLVGKGQYEGTWSDIGGTGKYDGCTGGGTWAATSMGPGISEITAEGERTFK